MLRAVVHVVLGEDGSLTLATTSEGACTYNPRVVFSVGPGGHIN
jgi:hypothetical protein